MTSSSGSSLNEIGAGRHADAHRRPGEVAHGRFRPRQAAQMSMPRRRMTGNIAAISCSSPFGSPSSKRATPMRIGVAVIAGEREGGRIDRHQVEVGVHDDDRPVLRDLVKMSSVEPLGWQEDRIETPGDQRLVLRQRGKRAFQTGHDACDVGQPVAISVRPGRCGPDNRHRHSSTLRPPSYGRDPRRSPASAPPCRSGRRGRTRPRARRSPAPPTARMQPVAHRHMRRASGMFGSIVMIFLAA